MTLPEDLAIYLPRPGRSHPLDRYARVARFAPGSDEAIVLAAMRRARFSLWRVERRHPTTGLILRDLLRGGETWLVDEAMEKNAPPGVEMAARLLQPESFAMTARIIVPLLPDLMTLPGTDGRGVHQGTCVETPPGETLLPGTRALQSASIAPPWPQERWIASSSNANRPALCGWMQERRPSESAKVQVRPSGTSPRRRTLTGCWRPRAGPRPPAPASRDG